MEEAVFLVLRFLTVAEDCIARGPRPAVDEALDRESVETKLWGTSLTMKAVALGAGCDPSRELGSCGDVFHWTSSSDS